MIHIWTGQRIQETPCDPPDSNQSMRPLTEPQCILPTILINRGQCSRGGSQNIGHTITAFVRWTTLGPRVHTKWLLRGPLLWISPTVTSRTIQLIRIATGNGVRKRTLGRSIQVKLGHLQKRLEGILLTQMISGDLPLATSVQWWCVPSLRPLLKATSVTHNQLAAYPDGQKCRNGLTFECENAI